MSTSLGILVATRDSLDQLLHLIKAAEQKGVEIVVFFTGEGVLVTQDPRFGELAGRARLALCEVSFRALGLQGEVPGLGFKDFATQARHAEMLEDYQHYLVL
jgi:hypothetical protein